MKFPDPVIDIRDAISFVVGHISEVNEDVDVKADIDNIFLMGHSAGASILASLFLFPTVLSVEVKPRIKGVILQAAVYHFDTKVVDLPPHVVSAYHGSPEDAKKDSPLALLKRSSDADIHSLPNIITMVSEYEAPGVLESHVDFRNALREKSGNDVEEIVMKGHNHISPHVSLYTGIGQGWADEVVGWMRARVPK